MWELQGDANLSKPVLTFYEKVATKKLNFEEFKAHAITRMKLLRRLENGIPDFNSISTKAMDLDTHFTLKLVCAQARRSSKWFIQLETLLFKHRIKKNSQETLRFFLEKVWPKLNVTPDIEYTTFYDSQHRNNTQFDKKIKIHFTKCSEMIPKRIYPLKKGYLDFEEDVMHTFLGEMFRDVLEKQMDELREKIMLEIDERLIKFNETLFSQNTSQDNVDSETILKNSDIFPLCIKGILERLKRDRHLKYNDRTNLALFFKNVGMSLTECTNFFRSSFNCQPEEFNKNYLYNIRHSYGLEGKKANYPCTPCTRMIGMSNDGVSFGCPFVNKHDFVRMNCDLEDLDRDAVKCCSKVAATILGHELEKPFYTPAEYFKQIYTEKEAKNGTQ